MPWRPRYNNYQPLSTKQLLHAVKHYRAEVGEKSLSKAALKHIQEVKSRPVQSSQPPGPQQAAGTNGQSTASQVRGGAQTDLSGKGDGDDDEAPEGNLMNPALLLPFHLPTSTDMLVSYGAGFGGVNRERERRYFPSVPPDFLAKLDSSAGQSTSKLYENAKWSDGESS